MEVFTKSISVLLALIMSVSVTACDKHGMTESQPAETTAADVQTETAEKKGLKRVTVEEFANSLYIEGKHIPFPCTFGELCDSYDFEKIEEKPSSGGTIGKSGIVTYRYKLYLKPSKGATSVEAGFISCYIVSENHDKVKNGKIIYLSYYMGNEGFDISGIDHESRYTEMAAVLGEDYFVDLSQFNFTDDRYTVSIDFDSSNDDKIMHVGFKINEYWEGVNDANTDKTSYIG